MTTLSRNIEQEQKDTSKGASGDENDNDGKFITSKKELIFLKKRLNIFLFFFSAKGLSKQILLMTSLTRSSYINVIKTTDIKTLCKSFVPIFYQVPIMMQAGGGDEQIAFDYSPYTMMEKCLIHSEEHFINGSLNGSSTTEQKSTISSQYEGRSFSELNYITRPQYKLPFPSSEVQLISGQNIIEDEEEEEEYLHTESYFTLQIEQYLKNFVKQSYVDKMNLLDDNNNNNNNFIEYLRNVIWSNFLNKAKIIKPIINDTNNLKFEEKLQFCNEMKEIDTNLTVEVNNIVEKNRSFETMTGDHYESVPDLLKKAYGILKKIQNDKTNYEFQMQTKMFHDTETILEEFLKD